MAFFGLFGKKPGSMNTLELMRFTIIKAENNIKKINKDFSKMVDARRRSPSYDYKDANGRIQLVSDTDAKVRDDKIRAVNQKLLEDMTPLFEQLKKNTDKTSSSSNDIEDENF